MGMREGMPCRTWSASRHRQGAARQEGHATTRGGAALDAGRGWGTNAAADTSRTGADGGGMLAGDGAGMATAQSPSGGMSPGATTSYTMRTPA